MNPLIKDFRLMTKDKRINKMSRWTLTGLMSCVLCLASFSQLPPFINLNQSKLYFSKDSSRFMDFYKKIDELKEGKRKQVTIVHYGGSHIQAGFWTEVLMDGFQGLNKYERLFFHLQLYTRTARIFLDHLRLAIGKDVVVP
jgi:hypothetical protein